MNPIHCEKDLDSLRRQFTAYAVLLTWSKCGVLDALADGRPRFVSELPGDARAIRVTARILGHLGLLVRYSDSNQSRDEAWALSPTARALMASGSLDLEHSWSMMDDLTRLDQVLTRGGPVTDREGQSRVRSGGVLEDDPDHTHRFIDRLFRRSGESAAETARILLARVRQGRALDLGGGHGLYGHELATGGLAVILFDRSLCIGLAQEHYGNTLSYIAGDFMVDELGGPYDLILLSNIIHGLSDAQVGALFPRLRSVLRPGGTLALKDMFLDSTGTSPESAALFGLRMLLYTEGGRSYSVEEMRAALIEAGFPDMEHVALVDQGFALLLAS